MSHAPALLEGGSPRGRRALTLLIDVIRRGEAAGRGAPAQLAIGRSAPKRRTTRAEYPGARWSERGASRRAAAARATEREVKRGRASSFTTRCCSKPELHRMNLPNYSAGTIGTCVFFLLLGLAATGCGDDDVKCEVDVLFKDAQRLEISRAASDWNAFTLRQIKIADDGDWLIVSAPVPKGLGYAQGKRKLIRISPSTPDDQIYAVALHEFGHALGLRHVSRGVMDPDRQTIEFSQEDLIECRHAGACP
jgi:hypothetical protein